MLFLKAQLGPPGCLGVFPKVSAKRSHEQVSLLMILWPYCFSEDSFPECTKLVLIGPLHMLVLPHWTSYRNGGWFLLSRPLALLSSPLLSALSSISKVLLSSLISASLSFFTVSQFVALLLVSRLLPLSVCWLHWAGMLLVLFRTGHPKLSPRRSSHYLFNE